MVGWMLHSLEAPEMYLRLGNHMLGLTGIGMEDLVNPLPLGAVLLL